MIRTALKRGARVSIDFSDDPGMTQQSMRDEVDINNIMRKYIKTGTIEHGNQYAGSYDFAPAISFQEALELIRKGEEMFAALPAAVRKKFGNDPEEFLEFVQNEENLEEMRELGLAKPAIADEPSPEGSGAPSDGSEGGTPNGST